MGKDGLFRVSGLYNLCPREEVLASRFDIIRTWHKQPGLQITMDVGHLFHDLYRDIYFGPMGDWIGAWRCVRCGWDTDKGGFSSPPKSKGGCTDPGHCVKMPEKCGSCHAPFWVHPDSGYKGSGSFKEWLIEDHEIGISGHPDGWSVRVGEKRIMTDLKSHSYRGFNSRRKMRDGHDVQVGTYGLMCGDKGGEVWYLNKSPWGDHPNFLRQIVAPLDKEMLRDRLYVPMGKLREGLNGGPLPERVCVVPDVPRAESCQLCSICFDM